MKKMSIKARLTLWYTFFFLAVMVLGTTYLLSISSQISSKQQKSRLMDVVADTVKAAHFEYGELEDGDIDYYKDEISVFLYDTKGRLIAPKVNKGIQVDSVLQDQVVRKVDGYGESWMVYDIYAVQDETGFWVRGVLPLSGSIGSLKRMVMLALIAIPVLVLAAAAGGYWITQKAFAAVGNMAKAAGEITSGDDLSKRVPDDGSGDELSLLGRTMNSMLERLQESFETEKQFTSDVSHELRTPASVIISQCEYALSDNAGMEDKNGALESALRQAKRMSAIISQLLLLARAESGKFKPTFEEISISDLFEMVAMEQEEEARRCRLGWEQEIAPDVLIWGDETLLIRMLTNLVSNAIRYNRPEGLVMLRLYEDGASCVIEVEDTGVGIAREDLPKIWKRFYRADASRSSEGTGLGLAMAKWIAGVHGGDIEVRSEQNKGSLFTVRLPVDRASGKKRK